MEDELEKRIAELENQIKIELINRADIIELNEGFSFGQGNYAMFKQGKHYWGYVVIKKDSGTFTNKQESVGKFKINMRGVINSFCALSDSEWSSKYFGYTYIQQDSITICSASENGNTAKLYIDIVVI